jgi:predicted nicotinamide N-methyase
MALTARLALTGPDASDPEDLFGSALATLFPGDDVANQHGDSHHGLLYTSPHLPRPIPLTLAEVEAETERCLFSHYLWNSSLLLAELIEAGTLGLEIPREEGIAPAVSAFDVSGLRTIELGAGTGLPSIMAGLLGARRVVATDYPAPPVLKALEGNVKAGVQAKNAPDGRFAVEEVLVAGHGWGDLDGSLAEENERAFDRVLAADCLWMPWQHENLRRSIAWFLEDGEDARAWVVGAFHTGRGNMAPFFDSEELAEVGLEVEHLWERDCDGQDREWVRDAGVEDMSVRKRWLAVGVLRRIRRPLGEGEGKR